MSRPSRRRPVMSESCPEAEKGFLVGLLELLLDDPERARKNAQLVTRDAFTIDQGDDAFEVITGVLADVSRPTITDLQSTIRRRPEGDQDLFVFVVDALQDSIRSPGAYSLGIERHAAEVADVHRRRRAAAAGQDYLAAIQDGSDPVAAAKAVMESAESVAAPSINRLPTLVDALAQWRSMESTPVIETGFAALDAAMDGGLPVGGMTVIAAAPSCGKSALALQAVLGALELDPKLHAVWCLGEMTLEAIARRSICNWSTGAGRRVVKMLSAKQRSRGAMETADDLSANVASRLHIVKSPLTVERIEAGIAATGARVLVIDYVQLVRLAGAADRRAEIDGVVLRLRSLVLEQMVAAILISNIAKGVTAETRIGAICKESSELDFAADILLQGHTDQQADDDGMRPVTWLCKKGRDAQVRDLETIFDGKLQTFTNAAAQEHEEFAAFADRRPR